MAVGEQVARLADVADAGVREGGGRPVEGGQQAFAAVGQQHVVGVEREHKRGLGQVETGVAGAGEAGVAPVAGDHDPVESVAWSSAQAWATARESSADPSSTTTRSMSSSVWAWTESRASVSRAA